ncbi:MAG: hypothetical protein LBT92_03240 [Rickettsiales bacterium]|nr:hypothetical protein [Rickettsiales bacterium]
MNIFIIFLMTVMLATYQFFVSKRAGDVTIDKDEKKIEVEVNCIRQIHNYAASKNETTLNLDANGRSMIGTAGVQIQSGNRCTGSDKIKSYKYCLNSGLSLQECQNIGTTGLHCVATTTSMDIPPSHRAFLFKRKVAEIRSGRIDGREVTRAQQSDRFGMMTCAPVLKITEQKKLAGSSCRSDQFAIATENGYVCQDIPKISQCTAHEDEYSAAEAANRRNCTNVGGGSACCAKPGGSVCGLGGTKAVWNRRTRFYDCVSGSGNCPTRAELAVNDERGAAKSDPGMRAGSGTVSSIPVYDPYIDKFNQETGKYDCVENTASFITACRDAALANGHSFLTVSGLNDPNADPVCRVNSPRSASANESCTACGRAVLKDGLWSCDYRTALFDLRAAGQDYYDELKAKGCFSGCDDYEANIAKGVKNGDAWGIVYKPENKYWSCFTCPEGYRNSQAGGQGDGVCESSGCNSKYQVAQFSGGKNVCYTRWCRNIPSTANARVGKPEDKGCAGVLTHPYIVYNSQPGWNCVYCVRYPPQIIK